MNTDQSATQSAGKTKPMLDLTAEVMQVKTAMIISIIVTVLTVGFSAGKLWSDYSKLSEQYTEIKSDTKEIRTDILALQKEGVKANTNLENITAQLKEIKDYLKK